jgi:hypothetical protein
VRDWRGRVTVLKIRKAVTFSQIFSQMEFFMEYKINLARRQLYRGYMG